MQPGPPGLHVKGVSKRFGALQALESVDIAFSPGEVHAVLGENGAGKSTLMNLIAGFLTPDTGSMELDGHALPLGKPAETRRAGVGMIHQHFTLVPNLTVAENLALARLGKLHGVLDVSGLSRPALDKAAQLGWTVEPNARVGSLPVGAQQRIEILKSLADDQKVLLFDEPTAPLSPDEVANLLKVLRELAGEDRIVVLIAHKLAEVLAVSDRITVLRRGKVVGAMPRSDATPELLAQLMVGELPPRAEEPVRSELSGGLSVADLVVKGDRGEEAVRGISFEAKRGEILGIGGVDGNGQIELAEAIAGVRKPDKGAIRFDGHEIPEQVGYVPADRQREGLAMGMTVGENLLIGGYDKPELRRLGLLSPQRIRAWVKGLIERFSIKAEGPRTPVADLSGGNQQKVVVSRELDGHPPLIIAVNPTRGLDVKAAEFVHEQLRKARGEGAAVVLISADHDELSELASEVVYMSRGKLAGGQGALAVVGGGL